MKSIKLLLLVFISLPLLTNCEGDFNDHSVEPIDSGSADFSKYVAVGNSLSAGYQSGALYPEAQAYSFPNLIAQQIRTPQFAQPEIGNGYGDRVSVSSFVNPLAPSTSIVTLEPGVTPTQPEGGYQNLGIPGAVLSDYLDSDGGFAARFASSPAYAFVLGTTPTPVAEYFNAQNATFATFWLGNNDILGYVTSGGLRPFTSPTDFGAYYTAVMTDMLTDNPNLKMVVANIPSVTSIPFGTFGGSQAQAGLQANSLPGVFTQSTFYQANPAINMAENRSPAAFTAVGNTANPDSIMFLLTSAEALTWLGATDANPADADRVAAIVDFYRGFLVNAGVLTEAEASALDANGIETAMTNTTYGSYAQTFGVLPADAAVALGGYTVDFSQPFGLSAQNPIPNQFILDKNEINIAKAVTDIFNQTIAGIVQANSSSVALMDANAVFDGIVTAGGIVSDGVALAPTLGSLFSFDGVHPSNRGHGIVANEFIKVINSSFGTSIDLVKISLIPQGIPVTEDVQ